MGGGQGGPPSPGVQIWGAPPWRKKTPSPPNSARWTPPPKMGFFTQSERPILASDQEIISCTCSLKKVVSQAVSRKKISAVAKVLECVFWAFSESKTVCYSQEGFYWWEYLIHPLWCWICCHVASSMACFHLPKLVGHFPFTDTNCAMAQTIRPAILVASEVQTVPFHL